MNHHTPYRLIAAVFLAMMAPSALGASPEPAKAAPPVPGPSDTDPDKYKVILDNERVRVFRYHDAPGERTHMHHHEAFVLYVLAPFKRRLTFADGSSKERQFNTGDVIYMDAQNHIGENIGKTPTEALIVELKPSATVAPPSDTGWSSNKPPASRDGGS